MASATGRSVVVDSVFKLLLTLLVGVSCLVFVLLCINKLIRFLKVHGIMNTSGLLQSK